MKSIWGISYEEIYLDDLIRWIVYIKYPIKIDGKLIVGLNEKFLDKAMKRGVDKLILNIDNKEHVMNVPCEKALKQKDKAKEYRDLRIYHFKI